MTIFNRFGGNINDVPHFLGGNPPPKRGPNAYLNLDFNDWPDRIFLMYVRDRAIWIYGESENGAFVERLNNLIHRSDPETKSRCGV